MDRDSLKTIKPQCCPSPCQEATKPNNPTLFFLLFLFLILFLCLFCVLLC